MIRSGQSTPHQSYLHSNLELCGFKNCDLKYSGGPSKVIYLDLALLVEVHVVVTLSLVQGNPILVAHKWKDLLFVHFFMF